jgi:predicted nucleic acid-binding Zn ribbon protein
MDPDEFLAHHRRMHERRYVRHLLVRMYVVLALLAVLVMFAIFWRPQ